MNSISVFILSTLIVVYLYKRKTPHSFATMTEELKTIWKEAVHAISYSYMRKEKEESQKITNHTTNQRKIGERSDGKANLDTWELEAWSTVDFWEPFYRKNARKRNYRFVSGDWSAYNIYAAYFLSGKFGPLRILDAGCGMSLLPYAFYYMGHKVTAIDLSPAAILALGELAKKNIPKKDLLPLEENWIDFVQIRGERLSGIATSPKQFLEEGRTGEIELIQGDWNKALPIAVKYDFIYSVNGLTNATIEAWKASFETFFEKLDRGGLLCVVTLNCWETRGKIEELCKETGFIMMNWNGLTFQAEQSSYKKPNRYAILLWPTG